ncbi:putative methanogenesis marker protein 12 [Methanosarcina sp. Kolksee]|uniref:methanogenesis marker 12 protein n=1 Tax=Methanosarcina sp. Kolksee TaxID=1434099 RepID=UPI0006157F3D|nr:methanogenesis marker 12 protein [Methanosarcina sp. Kolksee]AKB46748.1 putative methanogenesis marker protein 12 [Methanosarcina sp. Kolksee]
MAFIGIDHGTTAMRFALIEGENTLTFELERAEAAAMSENEILTSLEEHFGIRRETIDLIALTYSMGDGFSTIKDVRNLEGRGLKSIEGAGKKTGGGTRVFDAIRNSGIPAIAIPGLHTESKVDSRMKVFSHLTSPEKLGIAYHILCLGYNNFVVSDISSNTVTLAVADRKVIGAIDACIFAPGVHHGPLDLQAIRDVDYGHFTANQAFMEAGALKMTPYKDREELFLAAEKEERPALLALDTISLFAAMEIASMQLLLKDYGTIGEVFLAGSVGEFEYVQKKIHAHLGQECQCLGKWHAAIGCAEIARDVFAGEKEILGVEVNYS